MPPLTRSRAQTPASAADTSISPIAAPAPSAAGARAKTVPRMNAIPRARLPAPVSPRTGRFRAPEVPEGRPHRRVMFTAEPDLAATSPGGTRAFRQVIGVSLPKLGPLLREDYVRYVGDEDNQRGRVEEQSVFPVGDRTVREALYGRYAKYCILPRDKPAGSFGGSSIPISSMAIPYIPPESRAAKARRALIKSLPALLQWLSLLVFAWLLIGDPGNWQAKLKTMWQHKENVDADSKSNVSRIFVDPFGTVHIPQITNISLSVNAFCEREEDTAIASGIANKVRRSTTDFTHWHEMMKDASEPELRALGNFFNEEIQEGRNAAALASGVESRMCQLANQILNSGLVYERTREFAEQIQSYGKRAAEIQPAEVRKVRVPWTAASPRDWDYGIVEGAFTDMREYLRERERLARTMSTEARVVFANYTRFINSYRTFQWYPGNARYKIENACAMIKARKWFPSLFDCDKKSHANLLPEVRGNKDYALAWSVAAQYYLKEAEAIWEHYATHLDDALSELANIVELRKALAAEGIPDRIQHLASLLNNLASQANNVAVLLQDAYEKKYEVTIDLATQPDTRHTQGLRPEPDACTACNERALSSWSSSSESARSSYDQWLTKFERQRATMTATRTQFLVKVVQPSNKWKSDGVDRGSYVGSTMTATTTPFVKVVNVMD